MKPRCLIVCFVIVIASICQGADFVVEMEAIAKLEKEGRWDEALNRYNKLSEDLKRYMDGYSVPFLYKKAICERQCRKYDVSEQTLWEIVKHAIPNKNYGMHRDTMIMAMFEIADVQARSGKIDPARKSLENAINFYEVNCSIDNYKGLLEWKDAKTMLIIRLINEVKDRDAHIKAGGLTDPKK